MSAYSKTQGLGISPKRVLALLRIDLANSLRDNMMLYALIAPILLAFAAKAFLPGLGNIQINFAVDANASVEVIEKLENFGTVELLDSEAAIIERVERSDDVPGIVVDGDGYRVILEGNEIEGEGLASVIMRAITLDEPLSDFERVQLEQQSSLLTEYATVTLIMLAVMIGALVSAFAIVGDKETKAITALGVSPISLREFTVSRAIFALAIGLTHILITTFVLLGTSVNYVQILIAFAFSSLLFVALAYLVGGFVDNQVAAIAVYKMLAFVYLTIPVVTIWIPQNWHFFFYILPNYWMWKTFETIVVGQVGPYGFWVTAILTFVLSIAVLLLMYPALKKRMGLRS